MKLNMAQFEAKGRYVDMSSVSQTPLDEPLPAYILDYPILPNNIEPSFREFLINPISETNPSLCNPRLNILEKYLRNHNTLKEYIRKPIDYREILNLRLEQELNTPKIPFDL